jgi:hypothetical protein
MRRRGKAFRLAKACTVGKESTNMYAGHALSAAACFPASSVATLPVNDRPRRQRPPRQHGVPSRRDARRRRRQVGGCGGVRENSHGGVGPQGALWRQRLLRSGGGQQRTQGVGPLPPLLLPSFPPSPLCCRQS